MVDKFVPNTSNGKKDVEKNEPTEIDKQEELLKLAKIDAEKAEFRAREAEANRKEFALTCGYASVEEFDEAIKKVNIKESGLALREKEIKKKENTIQGEIDLGVAEIKAEFNALKDRAVKLEKLVVMLKEENEKLKNELGIKVQKKQEIDNRQKHYDEHKNDGLEILQSVAKYLTKCNPSLSKWLFGMTDYITGIADAKNGMEAFIKCSTGMLKHAEYYQSNSKQLGTVADEIFNFICIADDELNDTLKLTEYKTKYSNVENEPPLYHQQQGIMDKIVAKFGR